MVRVVAGGPVALDGDELESLFDDQPPGDIVAPLVRFCLSRDILFREGCAIDMPRPRSVEQAIVLAPDEPVALAGHAFQTLPIQDHDPASNVADQPGLLERP